VRICRVLLLAGVLAAPLGAHAAEPMQAVIPDLVARLQPAVVNIQTLEMVDAEGLKPFAATSPFARFNPLLRGDAGGRVAMGQGSGFFIDAGGTVVTNNHVIEKASKVEVVLADGRRFPARVVGRDPESDLAVLQVTAPAPMPFVRFGSSASVRAGDPVIAIGNPFGLSGSVSVGVVSGRGRDIEQGNTDSFIQTDAAINQGNSGGPLFNLAGQVIGVNSAILSPSGASVGIGFAIPSDQAVTIVQALKTHGAVRRAVLGVRAQDLSIDLATTLGLSSPQGALITQINSGSAAQKAGLKRGDVILTIAGQRVGNNRDLARLVEQQPSGKPIGIGVWRRGKPMGLAAILDDRTVTAKQPKARAETQQPQITAPLGLVLRDAPGGGAMVVTLAANSPAKGKLQSGDILLEVNWQAISSPVAAQNAVAASLQSAPKAPLVMLVHRSGEMIYISITP